MRRISIRQFTYLFAILGIVTVCSCTSSGIEQYDKLEKKELAKGTRVDSLFLGISFGMTSKTFFGHCWELNKKGIISDGSNNTMVLYKIDSALKFPATMNFYPDFIDNKVAHMRVNFQYNAWAPWNKAQWADSLLPDVLQLYKKWYPGGNDFIGLTDKEKRTIYVKVDGNRRITLGKFDDMVVKADYSDLLVEEKLKKQDGIK
ncbi:hypothetical protein [Ferruginibacter sp.]|uniref:hypothetical protein n=1 Tax=Ferruginibacter sp. TaxID=1940288 RepID=UPI00265A1B4F|nr:hypothetical protein [Ferruginibacter sp.]